MIANDTEVVIVDIHTGEVIGELDETAVIFQNGKPTIELRDLLQGITPKGVKTKVELEGRIIANIVDYFTGECVGELYGGDVILHRDWKYENI